LHGETFRQVAREDARRVELLQPSKNGFDPGDLASEELRRAVEPGAQVTRLVDQIEKVKRDDPVTRVVEIGADLLQQVLAQGARAGCRLFDVRPIAVTRPVAAVPRIRLAAEIDRSIPLHTPCGMPMFGRFGGEIACHRLRQGGAGPSASAAPLAGAGGSSRGSRRSSNGFCWISASMYCVSSRLESCSILIACCSWGVMTSV